MVSVVGEAVLSWTPSEDQIGAYVACFVAMDMYSTLSTPYCVPLIASVEDKEVYTTYSTYHLCIQQMYMLVRV